MDIITYSLINDKLDSNIYYNDISSFSDKVLGKLQLEANLIIDDFMKFIEDNNLEICRSREEYMVEYLTIGVSLSLYEARAEKLHPVPQKILSYLSLQRSKNTLAKPIIDGLRGILSTIFLCKDKLTYKNIKNLSLKDLQNLLLWMDASGDFRFASKRLNNWYKFLKNTSALSVNNILEKSASIAYWFKGEAKQALGKYTSSVDNFLTHKYPQYKFREDIIFCGKKEIEYHLNMVGAEILNKALRKDFLKTETKMVLLPACMRFHSSEKCKSVSTKNGYLCSNCTTECAVCMLTKMGKQNNFKVYIIPHESDAFANAISLEHNVGIVGIACVLNLLEGGWKAKDLGFVPQCVILDYCGCKNHWHDKGISTQINILQLTRILNK